MNLHSQNRRSIGFWAEFIRSFQLAWRLLRDHQVPLWAKLIPIAVLIYIVLPIDLLPDPILGLGQIDDLTLLIVGVQIFIAVSPRSLVRRHRAEMGGGGDADGSKPSEASKEIIDGK